MVAHHADVDERLEIARPQRRPRHPPERASVVAPDADAPQQPREDAEPHARARPRGPLGVGGIPQAFGKRVFGRMGEPRVESRRLVRDRDALPPRREHLLVRPLEDDVRLATGALQQPAFRGETAPQGSTFYMKDGWWPIYDDYGNWALNTTGVIVAGNETYVITVLSNHSTSQDWSKINKVCGDVAKLMV